MNLCSDSYGAFRALVANKLVAFYLFVVKVLLATPHSTINILVIETVGK